MFNQKQVVVNAHINWNSVLYGTLLALGASIALLIIGGAVMYYAKIAETWLNSVSIGIFVIGIFAGGLFASRKAGEKGLMHGLLVAVAFLVISSIITWLFPAEVSFMVLLNKVIFGLIAGALGGILGVK